MPLDPNRCLATFTQPLERPVVSVAQELDRSRGLSEPDAARKVENDGPATAPGS